jgi:hypothetical protein
LRGVLGGCEYSPWLGLQFFHLCRRKTCIHAAYNSKAKSPFKCSENPWRTWIAVNISPRSKYSGIERALKDMKSKVELFSFK